MTFKPGTITVTLGGESRQATLYKKNNGLFVYWSPFTNERIVLRRKYPDSWVGRETLRLERRLKQSQKCPVRE